MRTARGICWIAVAASAWGCRSVATVPSPGQPPIATPGVVTKSGFTAACPTGWKLLDKGGDYALAAVPKSASGGENDPIVAIEVPKLPPHIPGFLPLGGVAGGYVNDLKKRYPDQKALEQSTIKLDGSDARRIVSSFQKDGKPCRELALLAVHGDHVYVITGDCDASTFEKTKSAFDALAASLKWTS